jgi:hypothetical protein
MKDNNAGIESNEHPHAEYLDFTFSSFGKPIVDNGKGTIVLPVREFKIYSGFPGYDKTVIVLEGDLIFEGVVSSIRLIAEREISDTSKYKQAYKVDDGPFPTVFHTAFYFYIGGVSYDPLGWVEWDMNVVSIKVREIRSKLPTIP